MTLNSYLVQNFALVFSKNSKCFYISRDFILNENSVQEKLSLKEANEQKFGVTMTAINDKISHEQEMQSLRSANEDLSLSRGAFTYYVSIFLEFFDPPSPP